MINNLKNYIENSFLSSYLTNPYITDVSFNGEFIFYQHNLLGRKKGDVQISKEAAADFIRQVANLSERQFSYSEPILDISTANYRINAVHSSLARLNDEKVITFDIRIGSYESKIKNDPDFMSEEVKRLLHSLIRRKESIIIAGPTGSGKTELQKYLISLIPKYSRVITIDTVEELENVRSDIDIDFNTWQVSKNNPNGSFENLIKNALRNNPDWIIVSEARGSEMIYVLNSVMTGHPIITTIHAKSSLLVPHRITRMIQLGDRSQTYNEIINDVFEHIKYYLYVNLCVDDDGTVHRFIEEISMVSENSLKLIYKKGEINYEDNIDSRNK